MRVSNRHFQFEVNSARRVGGDLLWRTCSQPEPLPLPESAMARHFQEDDVGRRVVDQFEPFWSHGHDWIRAECGLCHSIQGTIPRNFSRRLGFRHHTSSPLITNSGQTTLKSERGAGCTIITLALKEASHHCIRGTPLERGRCGSIGVVATVRVGSGGHGVAETDGRGGGG